jgi:hypothetical protein
MLHEARTFDRPHGQHLADAAAARAQLAVIARQMSAQLAAERAETRDQDPSGQLDRG